MNRTLRHRVIAPDPDYPIEPLRPADDRPRCACGDLLTVEDWGTCRQCRLARRLEGRNR